MPLVFLIRYQRVTRDVVFPISANGKVDRNGFAAGGGRRARRGDHEQLKKKRQKRDDAEANRTDPAAVRGSDCGDRSAGSAGNGRQQDKHARAGWRRRCGQGPARLCGAPQAGFGVGFGVEFGVGRGRAGQLRPGGRLGWSCRRRAVSQVQKACFSGPNGLFLRSKRAVFRIDLVGFAEKIVLESTKPRVRSAKKRFCPPGTPPATGSLPRKEPERRETRLRSWRQKYSVFKHRAAGAPSQGGPQITVDRAQFAVREVNRRRRSRIFQGEELFRTQDTPQLRPVSVAGAILCR